MSVSGMICYTGILYSVHLSLRVEYSYEKDKYFYNKHSYEKDKINNVQPNVQN